MSDHPMHLIYAVYSVVSTSTVPGLRSAVTTEY